MVTGAALATVNRLPVLLFPGDTYATRRQGPVLQQLEHATEGDVSVNDCFRPVARFFDRITRPEQLLTALPEAMRVLTSPAEAGAVVIALPQDIQTEAYDFPAALFEPRDWTIYRAAPSPDQIAAVAELIAAAEQPLIIAGGGVLYSQAESELAALAEQLGIPVVETFAGKGAVQQDVWWGIGGRRPRGQSGRQRAGEGGRSRHPRGHPADGLHDRLAVGLRAPGRALRVDQRRRPRRPQAGRHAGAGRREAGPRGAARRDRRTWRRARRGASARAARSRRGCLCAPRRWRRRQAFPSARRC